MLLISTLSFVHSQAVLSIHYIFTKASISVLILHVAVNPRVDESLFLKVSIFHLLVRSLINTVSMGSVCVEQMAQASLGEMKNANLSNAAKTTWLEISLGGGLNSHLKTHLAGTHTFLLSSTLCTILILLYLSSSHSALSLSAPPGRRCLLFPLLNMLYDYDGIILYSMFCALMWVLKKASLFAC